LIRSPVIKRLLTCAVALSLLGGPLATAQPYDQHRDDRGQAQQSHDNRGDQRENRHDNRDFGHDGGNGHHWARGERMPNTYYEDRGHYVDYRTYHLRRPPHGYRWVRTEDNNYAMVAIATGLIAAIIASNR
jgi:Ni/Co efflux regulator RcnB